MTIQENLRRTLETNLDAGNTVGDVAAKYGEWLLSKIINHFSNLTVNDFTKVSSVSILSHLSMAYNLNLTEDSIRNKKIAKNLKKFIRVESKPILKEMYLKATQQSASYDQSIADKAPSQSVPLKRPRGSVTDPEFSQKKYKIDGNHGLVVDMPHASMNFSSEDKAVATPISSGLFESNESTSSRLCTTRNDHLPGDKENQTHGKRMILDDVMSEIEKTRTNERSETIDVKTPGNTTASSSDMNEARFLTLVDKSIESETKNKSTALAHGVVEPTLDEPGMLSALLVAEMDDCMRPGRLRSRCIQLLNKTVTGKRDMRLLEIVELEIGYVMSLVDILKQLPRFKFPTVSTTSYRPAEFVSIYLRLLTELVKISKKTGIMEGNKMPGAEKIMNYVSDQMHQDEQ